VDLFQNNGPLRIAIQADDDDYEYGPRSQLPTSVPGVALLRACHQIHYEAAGFLYGQNTILFHFIGTDYPDCLIRATSDWLTSIGRYISLVQSVAIDVGSFLSGYDDIDVLPLLKHLWQHAETGLIVEFTSDSPDAPLDYDVISLSRVLALLAIKDPLNIARYANFPRLMNTVHVSADGLFGSAYVFPPKLASKGQDLVGICVEFIVDDLETRQELDGRIPPSLLNSMMSDWTGYRDDVPIDQSTPPNDRIRQAILNNLKPTSEAYTYDLTSRTMILDLSGILGTNKLLRNQMISQIRHGMVRAVATAAETRATFADDLAVLYRWASIRKTWACEGLCPRKIDLRYELQQITPLGGLRYDGTTLIRATRLYGGSIEVSVASVNFSKPLSANQKHATKLKSIRDTVLDALDAFSEEHPEYNGQHCPIVWLDGEAVPREIEIKGRVGASEYFSCKERRRRTYAWMHVLGMAQASRNKFPSLKRTDGRTPVSSIRSLAEKI